MKTPDEIKKGLECCAEDECFGERENCPYNSDPNLCVGRLCVDTLAYVQRLETERDALVKALKCTDLDCGYCKYCNIMEDLCKCDCSDCELDADKCPCNECRNNSHWEWRGVKEETP